MNSKAKSKVPAHVIRSAWLLGEEDACLAPEAPTARWGKLGNVWLFLATEVILLALVFEEGFWKSSSQTACVAVPSASAYIVVFSRLSACPGVN